jgi:CheY-like chemotaxis protein
MRADPLPSRPPDLEKRVSYAPPQTLQCDILIVEAPSPDGNTSALRQNYRVAATADGEIAAQYLNRAAPSLVCMDIDIGIDAVAICRMSKSLHTPATVLVTTLDPKTIPDVLEAGCDGVLLKPFPPNLLCARIGRLLRTRGEQLRMRAWQNNEKAPLASTNQTWPHTACPSCAHQGVVSFEFASYRRAWYACLACKSVWMAKRQE